MTDPTTEWLPVWESMVADYGDPLADLHGDDDTAPQRRAGLPPVPTRTDPPTTPLPAAGRDARALPLEEAS